MIVVTGANGQLGRLVVQKLLERIPASGIAASVRDVGKATDLSQLGVRVRQGDFGQPESLRKAFEGATQVLMVSSNARAYGGDAIAQHRAAIAAAGESGARRIIYTSHMAASAASLFSPMHDHAVTEALLRDCGLAWTALRNGFYAASGVALLGDLQRDVEAPADSKVCWTAHADLAEAAAVILASEGRYDGPTPPLTASDALDLEDLTAIASDLARQPMRRLVVSDDAMRAKLVARGLPPQVVRIALGLYQASRAGEFATVDPTLASLLGRKPLTMRDVLAAKLTP